LTVLAVAACRCEVQPRRYSLFSAIVSHHHNPCGLQAGSRHSKQLCQHTFWAP
jgi:hypothetical protein